jgi:hypothetical protein
MTAHEVGKKTILPRAIFRALPIPTEQYRALHSRSIHGAQEFIDVWKTLHGPAIFAAPRAHPRPGFLAVRRGPSDRSPIDLIGIKVDMTVDHTGHGMKLAHCRARFNL